MFYLPKIFGNNLGILRQSCLFPKMVIFPFNYFLAKATLLMFIVFQKRGARQLVSCELLINVSINYVMFFDDGKMFFVQKVFSVGGGFDEAP